MVMSRLRGCAVSLVLTLAACGGGGGDAGDTAGTPASPEPPVAPAPPPAPPTTPPATPGSAAPAADAGPDQNTVEEQDVTIDGSRTRDPDGDSITYDWELMAAPAGSSVSVDASSATFAFRPDLPGRYELRLTVSDGLHSASDTMAVEADALLTFESGGALAVDAASGAGSDKLDLNLRTSAHYSGSPIAFTASSNAPWLLASTAGGTSARPGSSAVVALQLDITELGRLANGKHDARVTITPQGGYEAVAADVSLELDLPVVQTLTPYVLYTGKPSRVTLYGEGLAQADGRSLFVNGIETPAISAAADNRATVELPALAAGTFSVRIGHDLAIPRDMARLVVREAPLYEAADLAMPGHPASIDYDAERDAFYIHFDSPVPATSRLQRAGGIWQLQPISNVAGPLRLSVDGLRVYAIGTGDCTIHELEPATLSILQSASKTPCDRSRNERFVDIWPLADGRVLLMHDAELQSALEYPGFERTDLFPAARVRSAHLTYERNRLFWMRGAPSEVFYHDAGDSAARAGAARDIEAERVASNGDGSRVLDEHRLYDRELQSLGELQGRLLFPRLPFVEVQPEIAPGLNYAGTRAVSLDFMVNAITLHDISGAGSTFPRIADIPLPADVLAGKMFITPADSAAFAFTQVGEAQHHLFIRTLPP